MLASRKNIFCSNSAIKMKRLNILQYDRSIWFIPRILVSKK